MSGYADVIREGVVSEWYIAHSQLCCPNLNDIYFTKGRDNGFESDIFIHSPDNNGFFADTTFIGSIRLNQANDSMWFKGHSDSSYKLIFTLNLDVSDSFEFSLYGGSKETHRVDSVYYLDSVKHIRFDKNVGSQLADVYWEFIEGVGPNIGFEAFLTNGYYGLLYPFVTCKSDDGVLTYVNELGTSRKCDFISSVGKAPQNQAELRIYPVPFEESVYVEWSNANSRDSRTMIVLIDSKGQVVFQSESGSQNKVSLKELSNIPKGVYFLCVQANNFNKCKKITKW